MPTQNHLYTFPQIAADLVLAISSCPYPIDREGFHYPDTSQPQLTTDNLTPADAFRFELARIWLRNFGPERNIAEKRRHQWERHHLYPTNFIVGNGMFLAAAFSMGFSPIHLETALSKKHGFQILLLDVDRNMIRDFRRAGTIQTFAVEVDVFCATPAVQMLLEASQSG